MRSSHSSIDHYCCHLMFLLVNNNTIFRFLFIYFVSFLRYESRNKKEWSAFHASVDRMCQHDTCNTQRTQWREFKNLKKRATTTTKCMISYEGTVVIWYAVWETPIFFIHQMKFIDQNYNGFVVRMIKNLMTLASHNDWKHWWNNKTSCELHATLSLNQTMASIQNICVFVIFF